MSARRFLADQRGLAAVELAFVAPAFLAMAFGLLQGGLMVWRQMGLQHATERAARCAAVNPSLCGSSELVQAYAVSQGLAANLPGGAFTLTNEACGSAVTGASTARVVTWTISLSARSCFPR